MSTISIIGERERANLVVRTALIFYIYDRIVQLRMLQDYDFTCCLRVIIDERERTNIYSRSFERNFGIYIYFTLRYHIIGERERANLVVRTARIFLSTTVRRPTAHAPGLRASFYPKGFQNFTCCMPVMMSCVYMCI